MREMAGGAGEDRAGVGTPGAAERRDGVERRGEEGRKEEGREPTGGVETSAALGDRLPREPGVGEGSGAANGVAAQASGLRGRVSGRSSEEFTLEIAAKGAESLDIVLAQSAQPAAGGSSPASRLSVVLPLPVVAPSPPVVHGGHGAILLPPPSPPTLQALKDWPSEEPEMAFARLYSVEAMQAQGLSTDDADDFEIYGKECFSEDFLERLSSVWHDPRGTHAGGEAETDRMVSQIEALGSDGTRVLDVCCGSGATIKCLAEEHPKARFVGVDISKEAVAEAREACMGLHNAEFRHGTIFSLPFKSFEFDVILAQDPDGFSHPERLHAFAECYRVLKPDGVLWLGHHWIPAEGWAQVDVARYNQDLELGWDDNDLCASSYLSCMKEVGFIKLTASDMHDVAARHFKETSELMAKAGLPDEAERLQKQLGYADRGLRFGLTAVAFKHDVMGMIAADRWEALLDYVRTLTAEEAKKITTDYGFTLLHEAAKEGQLDLAIALVEEKGFDVDVLDGSESTPLYRSFGFGRTELIDYLIEKGANLKHINANKDSMLHNTTYVGDAVWSTRLIQGGWCDPFLEDNFQTIPLITIIDKIPDVASVVFDMKVVEKKRFVQHRLIRFDFSGLEHVPAGHPEIASPIEKIVEEEHMDLMKHFLIEAYFQLRWDAIAKMRMYLEKFYYALAATTVISMLYTRVAHLPPTFPQLRWDAFAKMRLYLEIFYYVLDLAATTVISMLYKLRAESPTNVHVAVVAAAFLLLSSARCFMKEKKQHSLTKSTSIQLNWQLDLPWCGRLRLHRAVPVKKYWFDMWNIFDLVTHMCATISTVTVIVTFATHTYEGFVTTNTWVVETLMLLHVLLWTRSLKLVGVFKTTGPYIRTIIKMVADLGIFFSFFLVFWVGFTLAWYTKFPDEEIGGVWDTALLVLRSTVLGDSGNLIMLLAEDGGVVPQFLFVLMLLLLPLMLANLLIAMMNNSYSIVQYKAEEEWMVVWVGYIMEVTASIDKAKLPALLKAASLRNLANFPVENQTSLDEATLLDEFGEDLRDPECRFSFQWVDKAPLGEAHKDFSLLLLRDELKALMQQQHEAVLQAIAQRARSTAHNRNYSASHAASSAVSSPRSHHGDPGDDGGEEGWRARRGSTQDTHGGRRGSTHDTHGHRHGCRRTSMRDAYGRRGSVSQEPQQRRGSVHGEPGAQGAHSPDARKALTPSSSVKSSSTKPGGIVRVMDEVLKKEGNKNPPTKTGSGVSAGSAGSNKDVEEI